MPTSTSPSPAVVQETAERLRHAVARLARLLRQQDEGGHGATVVSALSTVRDRGPLTLGELAALEQVAPPTMTRVVEKLEVGGFITRQVDAADRRVTRVTVTAAGSRYLDATRDRRTAWLVSRLADLDPDDLARLAGAVGALEVLVGGEAAEAASPSRVVPPAPGRPRPGKERSV